MARTVAFVSQGKYLGYANAGQTTISAGDVVFIGDICGIANVDIPAGGTGTVYIVGLCRFPAKSTDNITVGSDLYWDAVNKEVTLTAADGTLVGVAISAAGDGVTAVRVALNMAVAAATAASTTKAGVMEIATLAEALLREDAVRAITPSCLPAYLYPATADLIVDGYGKNGDLAFLSEVGKTVAVYEKISGHWAVKIASQAFTPAG
ncbi:MAG: DUF2190 family protein [Synergistaceae bacterium]|nr:DUF2190 family protein [Synergistaceae bacterium]